MEPPYPPIGRIGTPLHKAALHQPVDHTAHRDALNLKGIGEFGLGGAVTARKIEQRSPLLPRHAQVTGSQIESVPYLTR